MQDPVPTLQKVTTAVSGFVCWLSGQRVSKHECKWWFMRLMQVWPEMGGSNCSRNVYNKKPVHLQAVPSFSVHHFPYFVFYASSIAGGSSGKAGTRRMLVLCPGGMKLLQTVALDVNILSLYIKVSGLALASEASLHIHR